MNRNEHQINHPCGYMPSLTHQGFTENARNLAFPSSTTGDKHLLSIGRKCGIINGKAFPFDILPQKERICNLAWHV